MPRVKRLAHRFASESGLFPIIPLPHDPDPSTGGPGGTTPAAGATGPTGATGDPGRGFPADKPVVEMTTDEQLAYYKHHSRKHEERAREAHDWRKANETKVTEYDTLMKASQTEQEKALEAAKAEALKAGQAMALPQLVLAEFVAAAAGKAKADGKPFTRDDITELVAPLDKNHFLSADGNSVDTAKVEAYVGKFVATAGQPGSGQGFPNLGQGAMPAAVVTGKAAGLAEAERRFGKAAAKQSA